eukprot:c44328_g1_i1 orf=3-182(-)
MKLVCTTQELLAQDSNKENTIAYGKNFSSLAEGYHLPINIKEGHQTWFASSSVKQKPFCN